MLAINEILEVLRNGKWHDVREVAEKTGLHKFKIELITSFLAEYDFVERDPMRSRVKLTPQLLSFLKKIQNLEMEEVLEA